VPEPSSIHHVSRRCRGWRFQSFAANRHAYVQRDPAIRRSVPLRSCLQFVASSEVSAVAPGARSRGYVRDTAANRGRPLQAIRRIPHAERAAIRGATSARRTPCSSLPFDDAIVVDPLATHASTNLNHASTRQRERRYRAAPDRSARSAQFAFIVRGDRSPHLRGGFQSRGACFERVALRAAARSAHTPGRLVAGRSRYENARDGLTPLGASANNATSRPLRFGTWPTARPRTADGPVNPRHRPTPDRSLRAIVSSGTAEKRDASPAGPRIDDVFRHGGRSERTSHGRVPHPRPASRPRVIDRRSITPRRTSIGSRSFG
jgi:hypothetical protein